MEIKTVFTKINFIKNQISFSFVAINTNLYSNER